MDYKKKIAEQINQYAEVDNMHSQLSSINDYWKQKYMKPGFVETTGSNNHIELYANTFIDAIKSTNNTNLLSIGSGDGKLELEIAKKMKSLKCDNFKFDLLELSPFQNKRAIENFKNAGLELEVTIIEEDFNQWKGDKIYSGIMAHHALHHVQDLEHLFKSIKNCLHGNGAFITMDMIGRNGHMRWPEALEIIELIWKFLPEQKKYNTLLKKTFKEYYNHDCSNQGFEGIRAQDILPLLVSNFNFEVFYAYGNLIDEFINRAYGPNFDPKKESDRAFIDFMEYLNSLLLELGHLKPTKMISIMRKSNVKRLKYYKNLSPEFCIRK